MPRHEAPLPHHEAPLPPGPSRPRPERTARLTPNWPRSCPASPAPAGSSGTGSTSTWPSWPCGATACRRPPRGSAAGSSRSPRTSTRRRSTTTRSPGPGWRSSPTTSRRTRTAPISTPSPGATPRCSTSACSAGTTDHRRWPPIRPVAAGSSPTSRHSPGPLRAAGQADRSWISPWVVAGRRRDGRDGGVAWPRLPTWL